MKRAIQKGFTLVELMIVVAVIAILAGYALPAFKTSQGKAQVGEAINLAASFKGPIGGYFDAAGALPTSNEEAGVPAATAMVGKYTLSVAIGTGGVITATMKGTGDVAPGLEGSTWTLTPSTTSGGTIQWTCAGSVASMKPSTCK